MIYPTRPDFANLETGSAPDVPDWWHRLLPIILEECERREENLSSNFTYGSPTARPLYFSAEDYKFGDIVTEFGLERILKSLMMDAKPGLDRDGPLQKRAYLSLQYNDVGRPGEVKFNDTAHWMSHPQVKATDIQWMDMKTLLWDPSKCLYA